MGFVGLQFGPALQNLAHNFRSLITWASLSLVVFLLFLECVFGLYCLFRCGPFGWAGFQKYMKRGPLSLKRNLSVSCFVQCWAEFASFVSRRLFLLGFGPFLWACFFCGCCGWLSLSSLVKIMSKKKVACKKTSKMESNFI